jgi:cell division septum initiation protein DivIVA
MTTEYLDKIYLEYSNLTSAKTQKELALEKKIEELEAQLVEAEDKLRRWAWDRYEVKIANIFVEQIFNREKADVG